MFRLIFASDIHGSRDAYLKLLNSLNYYDANAIVIGGDITGKFVLPIIRYGTDYVTTYNGVRVTFGQSDLDQKINAYKSEGVYPAVLSKDEYDEVANNEKKRDELFLELMKSTLQEWAQLAEDRLSPKRVPLYFNFGNDDREDLDEFTKSLQNDNFVLAGDRVISLGDEYPMISSGYANKTPWNAPRDLSEEEFLLKLRQEASKVSDYMKAIFNVHCPPYNTALDKAMKLQADGKIAAAGGHVQYTSVGSTAVRTILEECQPLLGLHGHIHESRGLSKIGRTVCINPGSEYHHGILRFCLIALEGKKVQGHLFLDG